MEISSERNPLDVPPGYCSSGSSPTIKMYSLLSVWTPVALYFLRASATPSPHVGPLFARQIDRNDKNYYIGYHGDDFETPYAKYFNATQPTLSEEFISGLQVLSPNFILKFGFLY